MNEVNERSEPKANSRPKKDLFKKSMRLAKERQAQKELDDMTKKMDETTITEVSDSYFIREKFFHDMWKRIHTDDHEVCGGLIPQKRELTTPDLVIGEVDSNNRNYCSPPPRLFAWHTHDGKNSMSYPSFEDILSLIHDGPGITYKLTVIVTIWGVWELCFPGQYKLTDEQIAELKGNMMLHFGGFNYYHGREIHVLNNSSGRHYSKQLTSEKQITDLKRNVAEINKIINEFLVRHFGYTFTRFNMIFSTWKEVADELDSGIYVVKNTQLLDDYVEGQLVNTLKFYKGKTYTQLKEFFSMYPLEFHKVFVIQEIPDELFGDLLKFVGDDGYKILLRTYGNGVMYNRGVTLTFRDGVLEEKHGEVTTQRYTLK